MFEFVDLFSGVGGFHAALSGLGGRVVQAAEIDRRPARVYELNWGHTPVQDVRELAKFPSEVPDHAVLAGGFPCQPFSKSGRQLGIAEDRGTLFHDILSILEAKTPPVVILENVRNLAGPRQQDAWRGVIEGLRDVGYRVSSTPCVFSPHLLPPEDGGAAQIRERLYIMGVYVGRERATNETDVPPAVLNVPQNSWDPDLWSIESHVLLPELQGAERQRYAVKADEEVWIDTWNEFLAHLGNNVKLPGFPLWEAFWSPDSPQVGAMPKWKQDFVTRNHDFYLANRRAIDAWRTSLRGNGIHISEFPASRRKLEWQAQDGTRDLWRHLLQLRPSGIRVKRATYAPALVAMNQTPIYGPRRRRLTPLEAARLQGFDASSFSFGAQADSLSYKQMGNAVNVGAVKYVFSKFVLSNSDDIVASGNSGRVLVERVRQAAIRSGVSREEGHDLPVHLPV